MDERTPDLGLWEQQIGAFARALGLEPGAVSEALVPLVGEPGAEALDLLGTEEYTPFDEVRRAFERLPVPVARLRKALAGLRTAAAPAPSDRAAEPEAVQFLGVLPLVPDDESFVAALKVGGELKIGTVEVLAAIKAALANRVKLYDLPGLLQARMEEWSEKNEEPCSESWYAIRKLIVRREYAPVLGVLGLDGHFVSQRRKELFFKKLDAGLWPALHGFYKQLRSWQETWTQGVANPGLMLAAMTSAVGGGGGKLPAGMLQPPDTAFLRDHAEAVIVQINRVFAGTGIPVARALAYEAQQVRRVLEDERLPAALGAQNREQMLKLLGIEVTADFLRLEKSIVHFALGVVELPRAAGGTHEILYLSALMQVGGAVPWDKLSA